MKIKRKELQRLRAELAHYRKILNSRMELTTENNKLLDVSLEQWYLISKFQGGLTHTEWIVNNEQGWFRLALTPSDGYYTAYDYWILNKYGGKVINGPGSFVLKFSGETASSEPAQETSENNSAG